MSKRPVRVVQFGAGNFLRGFCDWMVDILNEKTDFNGNVIIVQPIRRGKGIALASQDGRFTVKINNDERLIQCIDSIVDPYADYDKFLSLAENPDLEFVFSNSTEAGIAFGNDETFPARATALLFRRYQKLPDKGLTFLPSELIEKNGTMLKSVVLQYADHWKLPAEFKKWIDDKIIFVNTLVDRIVSGVGDKFGVMTEPFHLWVLEGSVPIPFHKAGLNVMFVRDIAPYRNRKVRILNGAHTTLVPVAFLKGFRTVRESVEDAEVGSYLHKAIHEEIIPTLDLPKEELTKFADEVMDRFRNPYIRHELSSIALNSISKYKVRVLPSVLRYIELKQELPKRLLYSLAALIKLYKTNINDTPPVTEFFKQAWANDDAVSAAKSVLGNEDFWGVDLNDLPGLNKLVTENLKELDSF
jgi:tagaturonate reductase